MLCINKLQVRVISKVIDFRKVTRCQQVAAESRFRQLGDLDVPGSTMMAMLEAVQLWTMRKPPHARA